MTATELRFVDDQRASFHCELPSTRAAEACFVPYEETPRLAAPHRGSTRVTRVPTPRATGSPG
jgi:hypothetical protein